MSLGDYPQVPPQTAAASNGMDIAPTPYVSFALPTSSGFGSGSVINLGVLTTGCVKIVFGYYSYTLSGTSNVTQAEQLSSQPALDYDTEAYTFSTLGTVPQNTEIIPSTEGPVIPYIQNPESSVAGTISNIEPFFTGGTVETVDVNDGTTTEVYLQSIAVDTIPDPAEPNIVEPIPAGEIEAISDSDFEAAITPGQPTVIAYDPQANTYLAVPESETEFTDNETIVYINTMKASFFYFYNPMIFSNSPLTMQMTYSNSSYDFIDGLRITFTPTSTTATGSFLMIGV
jgi:hypothetical protein